MAGHLRRPRAVSVGGGTGQANVLRALRSIGCDATAVVAMADDGGSTGALRRDTGTVPPGDVRKCLVALAGDEGAPLARAFQSCVPTADGHKLGNLVLVALAREAGSFPAAVSECERMLRCVGHVMPSTLEDVTMSGLTRDGRTVSGQAALCHGPCALERVWLEPGGPAAYPPAVEAILRADMVVLGPGSLYTSIVPNLLVPGVAEAVRSTSAVRVFVCPKADAQGETRGLRSDEYVSALGDYGLGGAVDVVLLHRGRPDAGRACRPGDLPSRAVPAPDAAVAAIEGMGPAVMVRDFDREGVPASHDVAVLADCLGEVVSCRSRLR